MASYFFAEITSTLMESIFERRIKVKVLNFKLKKKMAIVGVIASIIIGTVSTTLWRIFTKVDKENERKYSAEMKEEEMGEA